MEHGQAYAGIGTPVNSIVYDVIPMDQNVVEGSYSDTNNDIVYSPYRKLITR